MYEAENSYWWYVSLHKIIESFVSKTINKPGIRIFDAGCGTGRTLEILSKYGYSEGIDYEPSAIEFAKKRNLKNIYCADLNTWKNTDNKFDYIISSDVISNAGITDDKKVFENLYSSLNSGGYLILNLPAFKILFRKHDKAVFGLRRYRRKELNNILKQSGFQIYRSTYRYPFLFFVLLLKKFIEKFSDDKNVESDLKKSSGFVNKCMTALISGENFFIRCGISFPLGSSVFVVAKK